jgi:hypothetical protein
VLKKQKKQGRKGWFGVLFEGVTGCSSYLSVARRIGSSRVVSLDLGVTHEP